jgi:transcriptional regulator with XRE-family HTH domain
MNEEETVGQLLQQARVGKGLSREALALELKLPLRHIEAIEGDEWAELPPGRPRPLARQLAQRLGVDLEFHTGAFLIVPGVRELDPPDPRQERLERVVMSLLTAASALVVVWLVVPGPSLGRKPAPSYLTTFPKATLPAPPGPSTAPYPVLGELLPESPLTAQGVLVSLRAMDTCDVRIEPPPEAGEQPPRQPLVRTLRVSEPWRLRVKGPFSLTLENAGVVNVEVAGRHIPHGQSVGEAWTGSFDGEGRWLRPVPPILLVSPPVPDDEDEIRP